MNWSTPRGDNGDCNEKGQQVVNFHQGSREYDLVSLAKACLEAQPKDLSLRKTRINVINQDTRRIKERNVSQGSRRLVGVLLVF